MDAGVVWADHHMVGAADRRDRALTPGQRVARFRQRLAHEELVVHAPDYTSQAYALRNTSTSEHDARRGLGCGSMAASRRIGILTGGGDVPGLNSVIKSVVYRSTALGYPAPGIRR